MRSVFIISLLILISANLAETETNIAKSYFFILFDVCKNNSIIVKEYGVEEREIVYHEGSGNYFIILLSTNNNILFTYRFDVSFVTHGEEIDPITGEIKSREVNLECVEEYFRLPYFENLNKIRISYLEQLLYEMEICNYNNICERNLGENEINCKDCSKGLTCINIKDNICEPNCPEDPDCIREGFRFPIFLVFVILIIASIIIFLVMFFKRKT
ncbi:MAG: hypothetical protein QXQ14_00395 [Candidatus Aenigmatarchaeota archaeon]